MRITYNSAVVLQALARGLRYGFEIMDFAGLPSGTVYPILRNLEAEGFATSRWEEFDAARDGRRPRRRYYELTSSGREALAAAAARLRAHRRIFDDAVGDPTSADG